jgi:hypothetical protein
MHFIELDKLLPVESIKELYLFWLGAFAYRRGHKHVEKEVAQYVFLKSNEMRSNIRFNDTIDAFTYDFADLAAIDKKAHAHKEWAILESRINKEFLQLVEREG